MRMRRAVTVEDRVYISAVLPKVTEHGYHETPEGWLEAIDDGSVTPVVFEGVGGKYRGCALVCLHGAGRSGMSLYVAAFYGEADATLAERREALDKVARMAKANGCTRVTFNSTRKEWARACRRYGFAPSPYKTYERSV